MNDTRKSINSPNAQTMDDSMREIKKSQGKYIK